MTISPPHVLRLRSGEFFNLLEPDPSLVNIADIARSLAYTCRFNGHTERFYSVAEHSLNCLYVAQDLGLTSGAKRAVFLHDAAEAYIGDIIRPVRSLLPEIEAIERRIERAISAALNVNFGAHREAIQRIDNAVLAAERRLLFPEDVQPMVEDPELPNVKLSHWGKTPGDVETLFLHRYRCFERACDRPLAAPALSDASALPY